MNNNYLKAKALFCILDFTFPVLGKYVTFQKSAFVFFRFEFRGRVRILSKTTFFFVEVLIAISQTLTSFYLLGFVLNLPLFIPCRRSLLTTPPLISCFLSLLPHLCQRCVDPSIESVICIGSVYMIH